MDEDLRRLRIIKILCGDSGLACNSRHAGPMTEFLLNLGRSFGRQKQVVGALLLDRQCQFGNIQSVDSRGSSYFFLVIIVDRGAA